MSSQDETSETQQAKSFFCHSCSNNFRKAPDQVNIIEGMLAVFFAATKLFLSLHFRNSFALPVMMDSSRSYRKTATTCRRMILTIMKTLQCAVCFPTSLLSKLLGAIILPT
jgi:hypothetical protein